MNDMDFRQLILRQREFFATGQTLPISFRIEQLKKLKTLIQSHEQEIMDALNKDLRKPPMEAYLTEIGLVIDEINFIIKNLKKWAKPQKTATPFPLLWPGISKIYFEPYGCVLIIGPYNYPFLLTMSPLIGAISAGNCAFIKPSEVATHTQQLIIDLINKNFDPGYLVGVNADAEKTQAILQEKFDYIFYTGNSRVAKLVMEAAAKYLTPVTLELGGKSPCIVDETADLDFAARRIVGGKMLNAGQTCNAPDYLYIHKSCKDTFIQKLKQTIQQFQDDASYCKIINKKHFDRLQNLMQQGQIIEGGKSDAEKLSILPTLIDGITWQDPIMQDEIFGPLLPILTFEKIDDVISEITQKPKPLAFYIFTQNEETKEKMLQQVSFGGGCINDCILQIANMSLPFGGVGLSGMGNYHGQFSFKTFSHQKSIYQKSMLIDFKFVYPPYNKRKLGLIKLIYKLQSVKFWG